MKTRTKIAILLVAILLSLFGFNLITCSDCIMDMLAGKGYRVRIPFGPFLSLGAIIYFFFGLQILRWYYHLFL